jgi:signal transduction histidine kinase
MFARIAGDLLVVVSIAVLIGWACDNDTLKTVFPGLVTMKANTAIGMLLSGVALALFSREKTGPLSRLIATVLAVIVITLGALTLEEYLFGWNFRIDELFFRDAIISVGTSQPGRMAPCTAFSFILVGCALVTAMQPVVPRIRIPVLASLGATLLLIGGVGTVAQLLNGLFALRLWNFFGMAIHTAVGFVLLGGGLLALVKSEGKMTWVLNNRITLGFLAAILIMLATAGVSWNYTDQLEKTALEVGRTHEILKEIEEIRADKAILESGQRGYLILGDEQLLAPRASLQAEVRRDVDDLRKLTADDPRQQRYLDQLETAMAQRTAFTEQIIAVRRQEGFPAAQKMLAVGPGLALSAAIARTLAAMHDGETALLITRQNQSETASTATFLLLPVAVFLSLTLLSLAIFFLNAGVDERAQAEREIRRLNATLELRVAERTAELESANKELEAFSYSVSHDLRAPLRAVDGFSQAMLEDYGSELPSEGRHYLKNIREGAQRMGMLIDDLLTFSRLSRAPLNQQPVDTTKLVHEVIEDLDAERKGRKIEIQVSELPHCQGDPALLKQVWINLVSNAIKYTRRRDPAVIEIGCHTNPESVYFVRDNGAGFDMRYVHKLFGVFQRLHRADQFEGTGVGLAIVQRIVHRHGGRVWAEAALDRGATFYFTLNREPEA